MFDRYRTHLKWSYDRNRNGVTSISNVLTELFLYYHHYFLCQYHQILRSTIRGRSDKFLAYKRKTKILEHSRFISQQSLLLVRCTWPSDAPTTLIRLKNTFSGGLQSRPPWWATTSSFCPASDFFKFRNKKQSHGVKSGEYGGWGSSS